MTQIEFPVIEVFGPVVQGEGPLAGQVTHFVRMGLCDYRCTWCDTMYAVDPAQVKQNAERLPVSVILERLEELSHRHPPWVTLSGGNPVLHDLTLLVKAIHQTVGAAVAVETQGSKWRSWLEEVDMLIVSPKPPSSGMADERRKAETKMFMGKAARLHYNRRAIKIVVFNNDDLVWADDFMLRYPWPKLYLSVGTDPPNGAEPLAHTRRQICERYKWLAERIPYMGSEVTLLPQLHVLAYGHQRGV